MAPGRPLMPVVPIFLTALLLLIGACSSSNGDANGDFDQELQRYESAARTEAQEYAQATATEHLAALAQVGVTGAYENSTQAVLAVMKTLGGRGSAASSALCDRLQSVSNAAGKDEDRRGEIKRVTDSVMIDAMTNALLGGALTGSAELRDPLLDRLGVQATSPSNETLHGLSALQAVKIVDDSGQVAIPAPGTAAHDDYTSWLRHQATGLQSTVDGLTAGVREGVEGCLGS